MSKARQSLLTPVLVAVLAISFTITVLVAWCIMFTKFYVMATETQWIPSLGVGYWLILSAGCLALVLIITVLIIFLVTNIRQALYVRRQSSFIDSVTHELKSPLASISLCLETMETREVPPEMNARFIDMMKRDVDRLRAFIEHILEAGRLEHNEREVEDAPTHLPELVKRCLDQVERRHAINSDCIKLNMAVTQPERAIFTDPMALEIVLLNLLDNAIKYSDRENLEVRLTIREDGDWLTFEVKDKGIGISKKHLKKVFNRFHRVDRPDKPRVKGTGLGLYVVSSLVRRLGGQITAESDGEELGTSFMARLPLRRPRDLAHTLETA